MTDITKALSNYKLTKDQPIEHIVNTFYKTFSINDKVKHLSKAFMRHKYVLVIKKNEKEIKEIKNEVLDEKNKEIEYFVCQSKDVVKLFMRKNKLKKY